MRKALVAGGASGIGLAIATQLAAREDYGVIYIVDRAPRLGASSITLNSTKGGKITVPMVESYENSVLDGIRYVDAKGKDVDALSIIEYVKEKEFRLADLLIKIYEVDILDGFD